MEIRSHVLWKTTAASRLGEDPRPGKLALLHTGVVVAVQLVLALLTYWLNQGIASTGGLSGIGMRSVLTTAQTFLQYAVMILLPFWEIGFLRAALCFARGENADAATLTVGLRRFGPVLRLILLKTVLTTLIMFAAINVGSAIFTLTPLAEPVAEMMLPLMQAETVEEMETLMTQLPVEEMLQALIPALVISAVIFLIVYIPVFYRIRLADLAVMDDEKIGAFAALRQSVRNTKGNALKLFKLDLSFWWFYVLQLVITAIGFGDLILAALGVNVNTDILYLVFFLLQAAAQLLLCWKCYAPVQTAYAVAYDDMKKGEA